MNKNYQILGLNKGATLEEVKKAYRNLSKKYHPDNIEGDIDKFSKICDAYKSIERVLYDDVQTSKNIEYEELLKKMNEIKSEIEEFENATQKVKQKIKENRSKLVSTNAYYKALFYDVVYFKLLEINADVQYNKSKEIDSVNLNTINRIFYKRRLIQSQKVLKQYNLISQYLEIIFSFCTYKSEDEEKFYEAVSFFENNNLEYTDKISSIKTRYEENKDDLKIQKEKKKQLEIKEEILKEKENIVTIKLNGKKQEYGLLEEQSKLYSNNKRR